MAVSASSVHLLSIFDAAMRLMAVQERAQLAEVGAVAVGGRRLPWVEERFSEFFFSLPRSAVNPGPCDAREMG